MQKVFSLTNRYIVLATPLILYSLLSSVYLLVTASGGKIISLLFAIMLFALMTSAFISGWFKMVKCAILDPEREDPNSLMKEFLPGVGEYFLSALGAIFSMFVFVALIITVSYILGHHFIGDPEVTAESLSKAMQSSVELKSFVMNLTPEQLNKINLWNMLLLASMTLSYFMMFLYLPAIFFKESNPFKAFWVSLKDLFSSKIFKTVGVFSLIFVINFILSILSTLFASNVIMHFIITLLNFYFITAVGVGVFYYYYNNFIRPQVGQNVDLKV